MKKERWLNNNCDKNISEISAEDGEFDLIPIEANVRHRPLQNGISNSS